MDDTQGIPTPQAWGIELRAQGYSPASVRAMTTAVAGAARHAGVSAAELSRADVLAWLAATDRARWTRIKYVSWLGAWGAYAGMPGLVDGIRRPPIPLGVPRPVSEADLSAMLTVARGRGRAWILLGAYCGLRSHESAKVAAEDLETTTSGHNLRVLGKGGHLAVVPCPPVVVAELRRWPGPGRLWPTATAGSVQTTIRRVAQAAGVRCTSHQLRHRYGTAAYSTSRDLLLTQQLMRHRSPATTAGYAAVAGDRGMAIAAQLPGALAEQEPTPVRRLHLVR